MNTRIKLLTAAGLLADGFMAGAAMQANPLGGSMTGHESGEKISSSSMMGMMQEMTRMTQEEHVRVPARGHTVFEPGGRHLMLIGPTKALKSGDTITLTLVPEDGREIEIAAPVRRTSSE